MNVVVSEQCSGLKGASDKHCNHKETRDVVRSVAISTC